MGDGLDAAKGLAEDIGEGIGDGLDAAGDLAVDGLDAAGDLAEDVGEGIGEGLDAAGDLAGDGLDAVGDLAEDIGEGMGDVLEAAGDLAEGAVDAITDAVDGAVDDVDMYAGAGPRDLDDEGPTGGGNFAKVRACLCSDACVSLFGIHHGYPTDPTKASVSTEHVCVLLASTDFVCEKQVSQGRTHRGQIWKNFPSPGGINGVHDS